LGLWCAGCEAESKCNGKEEARGFKDLKILLWWSRLVVVWNVSKDGESQERLVNLNA
jgi:hypothetical protein